MHTTQRLHPRARLHGRSPAAPAAPASCACSFATSAWQAQLGICGQSAHKAPLRLQLSNSTTSICSPSASLPPASWISASTTISSPRSADCSVSSTYAAGQCRTEGSPCSQSNWWHNRQQATPADCSVSSTYAARSGKQGGSALWRLASILMRCVAAADLPAAPQVDCCTCCPAGISPGQAAASGMRTCPQCRLYDAAQHVLLHALLRACRHEWRSGAGGVSDAEVQRAALLAYASAAI